MNSTPSTNRWPNSTPWRTCWRVPHFMPPASVGITAGIGGNDVIAAFKQIEGIPQDPAELDRILKRAEAGDASTLPVLRKVLDTGHFTESTGNLARLIQDRIISDTAGEN